MKSNRFSKRRMLMITVSIVVIIALCSGLLFLVSQKISAPNNNDTDKVVRSAEEAAAQLKELGDNLGYENALSELTETSTATVDGDTYYRFQQKYQGIPVYGRTAVYVTDKNGETIAITGNVTDVSEDIDLTPTVTATEAETSIKTYLSYELGRADTDGMSINIPRDGDLCIYNMSDTKDARLAYVLHVDFYEFIIDAHAGSVLCFSETLSDATATTGYAASDDLYENGFEITLNDASNYELTDTSHKLSVYTLQGYESGDLSTAVLIESDDVIFGNSQSEIVLNAEAGVRLLLNVIDIQEYFLGLGFTPAGEKTLLFYNDGYDNGENARGGYGNVTFPQLGEYGSSYGLMFIGSVTGVNDIDVIAHEYTHRVSSQIVAWSGRTTQNGALDEALSDIFGIIIEAELNGTDPDWTMDGDNIGVYRNIANPRETGYRSVLSDDNTSHSTDEYAYATVISHAAYLMSENGGGLLDIDELGKLWYRAMLMMPSDCDFAECRTLVELAAKSMGLSDAQIACVGEAFDTVEISNGEPVDYEVSSSATLSVYGADSNLCSNYTMQIAGTQTIGNQDADPTTDDIYNYYIYFRQNTTTEKYYETRHITTTEPVSLDLKYGTYTITLIDDEGSGTSVSFKIKVGTQDGKDNIAIYTDFSKPDISTDKQLSRIVRYDEYTDALGYCYELSYNDKNQLVGLTQGQASSDTKHDPTFTYSPDGKLLWIITGEPTDAYAPGYNSGCGYEYNSSGQLTRTFAWEGGYVEKKYKYDPEEKCVSSVENGDFYTTTETHVYGADGTRLYSEVDTTFSDGHIERYVVEYDYSYEPFVLKRREDTGWKVLALQIDDNISVLNFFFTEEVQFYIDADGYLEKAETDGETYYFFYNDNEEKDIDSFASVVEQRIEKCAFYSLSDDQQQVCRGLLYDLDEDGQDELILQYLNGSGYDLEIWNNIRGNVACVCSAITDDGLSYQNLGVGVGLGAYNGERYLVWFWEYADEMRSNNTNFIKEKELIYKITNGNYEYNDILETSELEHISDIIGVAYPYYSGGMSLSELLAYLKNEDVAASPNAELKDAVCYNGHYYKVYNEQSSWEDAAAFCQSVGGHLATITSAEENTFLYDYLVSLGLNGAYFGFSDVNIEGEWAWCTGEEIAFTNWDSGEPNNEGRKEHYGLFDFSHNNGKWNDGSYRSASDAFFICEWDTLLQ